MNRLNHPKRLLIIIAAAAGVGAIAIPAAVGLSDNPSFSQRIGVRVPSSAHSVTFDDHGRVTEKEHGEHSASVSPSATSTATTATRRHHETDPGDDRGTHTEVTGTTGTTTHAEPGDDRGVHTAARTGATTSATATEPGDDNDGLHDVDKRGSSRDTTHGGSGRGGNTGNSGKSGKGGDGGA